MNHLKKILPLGFLTLLFLTACTNPLSNMKKTDDFDIKARQSAVSQASQGTAPDPFTSRYGTGLNCDLLKKEESRKNCILQMNDLIGGMLESEIISSFDIQRCKELSPEVAATCKKRLENAGVQGPVSDEDTAIFFEAVRGTFPTDSDAHVKAPSYPTYDVSKCATLKAVGYKAYCEKQIAERMDQNKFDEIIQSKNSQGCAQLSNAESMTRCKQFFGINSEIQQKN